MGPFQEYEVSLKVQNMISSLMDKGSPRSRIPRLVLHPFRPKDKGSPLSDSPFSEEEAKDCDISSDHSKRTISTNSFCSDDTGCPTSQSVSPSKTPSGSERSARGSPVLPERKAKVKRVRVMAEWSGEGRSAPRHKRELRSAMKARGSEADFSSSSSSASLKTRESMNSSGKKPSARRYDVSSMPLALRKNLAESLKVFLCVFEVGSIPSDRSQSNPSRYHSCRDNHGIRPPNPEQYLTPLQQKEVAIRHLKTKLLESENRVQDRETEIEELKGQLGRMREDWIEEECHRVEAQLSLKEARKEIKQLRQVVETMKSSLMEKDKGIQKYFIDINIQNRKLESLLHSMELAQSGSNLQEESALDFLCDSADGGRKKMAGEEDGGMELGDQGAEAMADSGLLVNDEMANRADIFDQVFMSTAMDFSQDSNGKLRAGAETGSGTETGSGVSDKGIQTDVAPVSPDLQALLLQLLKFHGATMGEAAPLAPGGFLGSSNLSTADQTPPRPSAPPNTPDVSANPGTCCSESLESQRFMEELDFGVMEEGRGLSPGLDAVGKRYWSNSFLVDLVAVAAPVLPTVAWLYSRHGVDGSAPVYNIAALIRGCCVMGLHSLRHATHRPDTKC
uniref:Syntabulin (syntaxin-interacting) n=1 Tax=Salarias fasciatus TaxID=181472 RepID=A0A672HSL4_SALFA